MLSHEVIDILSGVPLSERGKFPELLTPEFVLNAMCFELHGLLPSAEGFYPYDNWTRTRMAARQSVMPWPAVYIERHWGGDVFVDLAQELQYSNFGNGMGDERVIVIARLARLMRPGHDDWTLSNMQTMLIYGYRARGTMWGQGGEPITDWEAEFRGGLSYRELTQGANTNFRAALGAINGKPPTAAGVAPPPIKSRRIISTVPPYCTFTMVELPPPPKERAEPSGARHQSPRWHTRRGHERTYRNGKKIWIRPTTVGDISRGVALHDYTVKLPERPAAPPQPEA